MHLIIQNLHEFCFILEHMWRTAITLIIISVCLDPRLNQNRIGATAASTSDECQVTPVIHILQQPGCIPKPIPSYACIGRCASYVQVKVMLTDITGMKQSKWHCNYRCRAAKFGKWKGPACAVKNREKERRLCPFFAHRRNRENVNLERSERLKLSKVILLVYSLVYKRNLTM